MTIFMILLIIRLQVISAKRLEFTQTIASLSVSTRMEKGCRRCEICQSMEDENRLSLIQEWDTLENLMTHLKSEHFMVFRGAMNFLNEPCERTFYTLFQPAQMDEIAEGSSLITI